MLIRATELQAAGISAGNITGLAFDIVQPSGGNIQGFEIEITSTNQQSLSTWNNNNLVTNKLLIKQIELTKQALQKDLFRYDASEVMERRIGADKLLTSLKQYIDLGSDEAYKNLELIIEDLQSSFK